MINLPPSKLLQFINRIEIPLYIITIICTILGLYFALYNSPADYQQGETVRIMYIHVPSAYVGLLFYAIVAISSIMVIVYNSLTAEIIAQSFAKIGTIATLLCLITGSLWGKPTWGTYWVWDARLTSMFILFFVYVFYNIIVKYYPATTGRNISASYIAVIGLINLPIIKFSVDWWNTLHQPASIIRTNGIAIDTEMLYPLTVLGGGIWGICTIIAIWHIKIDILSKKQKKGL